MNGKTRARVVRISWGLVGLLVIQLLLAEATVRCVGVGIALRGSGLVLCFLLRPGAVGWLGPVEKRDARGGHASGTRASSAPVAPAYGFTATKRRAQRHSLAGRTVQLLPLPLLAHRSLVLRLVRRRCRMPVRSASEKLYVADVHTERPLDTIAS